MQTNFKNVLVLVLLTAAFSLLSIFSALAGEKIEQVKDVKIELYGQKYGDMILAQGKILWSYHTKSNDLLGFRIYYGEGKITPPNELDLMAEILVDSSGHNANKLYHYAIDTLISSGKFWTFVVTAFNSEGESEVNKYFHAEVVIHTPKPQLSVINHPSGMAVVNSKYSYIPELKTNIENPIYEFILKKAPEGAEIDSETGEISWIPESGGSFNFNLGIKAQGGGQTASAMVEWVVHVAYCMDSTIVSGTVLDANGQPVKYGTVTFFKTDSEGNCLLKEIAIMHKFFEGKFELFIDKGEYFVFVEGFSNNNTTAYYPVWYNNALKLEDAESIKINCGEYLKISFNLPNHELPKHYAVSGKVVDAESLEPVKFAVVDFLGKDPLNGKVQYFTFKANHNGIFEGKLPDHLSYIASAKGVSFNDSNMNKVSYMQQFYNMASDPTDAEVITLTENRSGIDFYLEKYPDYENRVYGTVTDAAGNEVMGAEVSAYLINSEGKFEKFIYSATSVKTDSTGNYKIENLIPGEYVIAARPYANALSSGFYVENDTASLTWQHATKVTVSESGSFGSYQIMLVKFEKRKGNSHVKGNVCKDKKVIIIAEESKNEVMSGASVYLLTSDNKVVENIYTDNFGKFEINGLPADTYNIIIDKVGYYASIGELVVGEEGTSIPEINLSPVVVSGVDELINANIEIYPNPAADFLRINFENLNNSSVSLLNLNGIELYSANKINGSTLEIPLSGFSSGMYIIKVINDNGVSYKNVLIMK